MRSSVRKRQEDELWLGNNEVLLLGEVAQKIQKIREMPVVPSGNWSTHGLEADPPHPAHSAIRGKYVKYMYANFQLFKGRILTSFRHFIDKTLINE